MDMKKREEGSHGPSAAVEVTWKLAGTELCAEGSEHIVRQQSLQLAHRMQSTAIAIQLHDKADGTCHASDVQAVSLQSTAKSHLSDR